MTPQPIRILIVDDTPLNLKIISAALAPNGYQLDTAANGRAGLDHAAIFQPDLIILDVMMPDLDGYEVCQRLRQLASFAQRPILMLTANDSLEERARGLDAGADDYMSKPFQPAELQARVKALLRRVLPGPTTPLASQGKTTACFSLRATWGDLATEAIAEIDMTLLDQVLMSHPSGVRVLAAAARPEQCERITGEHVRYVLRLLRGRYPYTVLDLPHDFSASTLAGLDSADEVLLILAPELASVRAAVCALGVFAQLDYPADKITLLLNTTIERGGLGRKAIKTALRRPILRPPSSVLRRRSSVVGRLM